MFRNVTLKTIPGSKCLLTNFTDMFKTFNVCFNVVTNNLSSTAALAADVTPENSHGAFKAFRDHCAFKTFQVVHIMSYNSFSKYTKWFKINY